MSTFDPRRHPRGLDGRFTPAPPPEDPDIGLAADLVDVRPDPVQAPVVLPADPTRLASLAAQTEATADLDDPPVPVLPPEGRTPSAHLSWEENVARAAACDELEAAVTDQTVATLAADPNPVVRIVVAQHPNTPPATLTALAADTDDWVRESVAANPHTPPDTLTRLAADPFLVVGAAVAENPNTPAGTLNVLADDPEWEVRESVVSNPNTPPGTLDRLTAGGGYEEAVARNPRTPPDTLTQLADHPDHQVRWNVADNPNTPPALLATLADDDSVAWAVARHRNTPTETLARMLATCGDFNVRAGVEARLPGTPPPRVAELARHGNPWVREQVAVRPGLAAGVLAELAGDPAVDVRKAARANPGFAAPGVAAHAGLLAD